MACIGLDSFQYIKRAVGGRVSRQPIIFVALCAVYLFWLSVGAPELSSGGRIALGVFGVCVLAWCLTGIDTTYIAVAGALIPTVIGSEGPETFFQALGDPMIWLLLSAFIIATAFAASGLGSRIAASVVRGHVTMLGVSVRLVGLSLVSALFIPSTSGRAALFTPVFEALRGSIVQGGMVKAIALLIPVSILLSAAGSLIGAGAHLLMVELIADTGVDSISYLQWLVWGMPFAILSCALSALVILHLFVGLGNTLQTLELEAQDTQSKPLNRDELLVICVIVLLVGLWISEPLHGVHAAIVVVCGAMIVTAPKVGAIKIKSSLKEVNWSLLLFLAATLKMGTSLVESGAATWLIERPLAATANSPMIVVALVLITSLLAHILITSRTARASVLIPIVLVIAVPAGLDPVALAFLSTLAAGYCLTLPVSAKPLAMFAQIDGMTFAQSDLLRLALWLIPLHLILLTVFCLAIWPAMGLDLFATP